MFSTSPSASALGYPIFALSGPDSAISETSGHG